MLHARNAYRRAFTLVEIMIVVLIIAILLAIAIPGFVQARESSRQKACMANLRQIEAGKIQYMMVNNLSTFPNTNISPTNTAGLVPVYIRTIPVCPESGFYTTGTESILPACTTTLGGATVTGSANMPTTPHAIQ